MNQAPEHPFDRDLLHVSFSQVRTYLLCPERFRQHYVRGTPPSHRSADLVFGSAVHAALAHYHRHLMERGEKLPVDEVQREFDALLGAAERGPVPVLWEDDEGPEKLRTKGHELLALYREKVAIHRIIAIEKEFVLPRTDGEQERLVGVVDLIEEEPDGTPVIVEIKTGARRFDDMRLQFDHQLSLYAAARETLGIPDAKLRVRLLLKTKKPAIETYEIRRDGTQLAETRLVVRQVLRCVDQQVFYPLRGWQCQGCPYRHACGT